MTSDERQKTLLARMKTPQVWMSGLYVMYATLAIMTRYGMYHNNCEIEMLGCGTWYPYPGSLFKLIEVIDQASRPFLYMALLPRGAVKREDMLEEDSWGIRRPKKRCKQAVQCRMDDVEWFMARMGTALAVTWLCK